MLVEWDQRKASANLRKHGVDFADAVIALEDLNALTIEDSSSDEQRFITLGLGPSLTVLLVVYAYRAESVIRIISARKADKSEIAEYYRGLSYE